jgi:hypothetical protein
MRHRIGLAALLCLAPAVARAQAPEDLLPAGAQVYLRWDGVEAHKDGYSKTALGKMMQGDTGTFVNNVFAQVQDGIGSLLTVDQLLGGVPPEKLQKMQADAAEAAKLIGVLGKNGFLVAAEVKSLEPPQAQLTFVVPDAGAKPDPLFGAFRLVANFAKAKLEEKTIDGRAVTFVALPPVHLAWWIEGKHAVVCLGTDAPDAMVKAMTAESRTRLTANALFKKIKGFDKFETNARAFVDAEALVKIAGTRGKEVAKLMNKLGLDGLKSLVFYSGFDGGAERGLFEMETAGDRKGVLALLNGKPFTLADVPALPPDVTTWSMTNFDAGTFYDIGLQAAESIVELISPEDVPKVKEFAKVADSFVGVEIRKDLLGSLGDKFVQYNSPSEGPLNLGQTILIKVKDAKKAEEAINTAIKGLAKLAGGEVSIKKRTYHGVVTNEVHVQQQGFFLVPTYAIHDGWLVVSAFPQQVQGYVRRAKGELPAWKPSAQVQESLGKMPKEFISISYSDPRPTINTLLSVAPMVGGLVNSFLPEAKFEVGSIPNAQEATHHLFPNVSITSDDGKTLRQETRASLALPFDAVGLDNFVVFFGFASVARFGF